jgi:hypothetical protein
MKPINNVLANAVSLAATVASNPMRLDRVDMVSIQCVISGGLSPVGTLTFEVSNDLGNAGSDIVDATAKTGLTTWTVAATQAIAADGDVTFNFDGIASLWCRVKYTRTSGSGVMTARANAKARS